ncbi:hypothetical protein JSQ73_000835 [Wolbachia endosymbiont of Anopheles demeilloni]|uniref:hypothetical protein n=1 Tax=Wolbachia endosymbiont of Anopheles demeilloni TaxID=2748871 RepID=UPI001F31EAB7|nr:hypothetical protein [Wolbachia endosymbiont of Anopheles demeilloni]UIP92917.1 hypothetical protein JSQ73_000835 [Wolbachia endosymbiont of Anopheles demeilloni]
MRDSLAFSYLNASLTFLNATSCTVAALSVVVGSKIAPFCRLLDICSLSSDFRLPGTACPNVANVGLSYRSSSCVLS